MTFPFAASLAAVVLVLPATHAADPPPLALTDATSPGSRWVTVRATTPGKVVRFVPLTPGLDPFPLPLVDGKSFVAFAERPGTYQILAYTAVDGEPSLPAVIAVTVGTPPPKPVDPGVPVPAGKLFFVVLRPDGPAAPDLSAWLADPSWATLTAAGHQLKDYTLSDAATALRYVPPAGSPLPCVVTLRVGPTSSAVVRGPIPIPTTADAVAKLPEGVK